MLKRYKWQEHTKCPRCLQDNEDTQHVLKCQGADTAELWENEMKKLEEWMQEHNIHSEIRKLITLNLNKWCRGSHINYNPSNPYLQLAASEQEQIGWFPFILGFWSKQISKCQRDHMESQASAKSPQLLLSKAQRKIWHIAWMMWDHRNKFLHEENKSYHPNEIIGIDREIRQEWSMNLDQIPPTYAALFSGTLEQKLKKQHSAKIRWLTTIWSLREIHTPDYLTNVQHTIEPMTRYRYIQWKENN